MTSISQVACGAIARWLRHRLLVSALVSGVLLLGVSAFAQGTYPDRPVRIVIQYPAGGMTDVIARAVGAELSRRLGNPVVIENRVGASGIVATKYVAGSAPDGYTLLMTLPAPVSSYVALYSKLPYDPQTQLRMISDIALPRVVVAVHPSVPALDVSSLLEAIRASPQPYAMGSWGLGTQAPMIQSFLTREYGLQILHVVYKGEGAMVADLLGGTINITAGSLAALGPQIQAGKLKPIALLGRGRSTMLPTLATFEEQGYGDAVYTFPGPVSLMAPSKTPGRHRRASRNRNTDDRGEPRNNPADPRDRRRSGGQLPSRSRRCLPALCARGDEARERHRGVTGLNART